MSKTTLPEHIAAVVKRETPGELIRWTGRPDAGYALKWSLLIYLFAVPWMAFSVFMALMTVGITGKSPASLGGWGTIGGVVALLFMVPFLAAGAAMLAAPLWIWRKAINIAYVVTDKRLLCVEAHRKHTKVKTIWPERIVSMERTERADGSGTLKLLLGQRRDGEGDLVSETEAITAVPDVRKLEQLLAAFRPQPTGLSKS